MIEQRFIKLPEFSRGFHLVTKYIESELGHLPEAGMVNIFIQHTSAGLSLNENVDPTVREDFETIMNKVVPESHSEYKHNMEGSDDMPAHVKSSLVGQSLTIPIANGRLALGMWQGIYLCEFRNYGGPRKLILTVYS
ncbi:secondary thiamine-phosphate synthase enzyme YjbQ [Alkalitalea saponilacus]|uniref:Secondary thiamine-phosphate synthase enzyme n=1 Tax=Alkalitalea saponilacus TaxID=889453 RepID=A0A1T5F6D1_9BACT|nr:secondary thiamine-phosphate synthase enzyme YjbQ [Alkalitalea saponilacus]ASB50159.1 secondary thiamine-phosphate synthase [Alkalitalea saponilacus]SKB91732.1 secondary thiamine-phosphate synthase enzyme [Alkalitalea saponilacus]